LQSCKCYFLVLCPVPWFIFLGQVKQGSCQRGISMHKMSVKVTKSQEFLDVFDLCWLRPVLNGLEFDWVHTMGAGVMVREPPMVGSLFRPLPHLTHLRYHFICLFYTIPMPNIFFCRREMDYLRIPVFWGSCHLLSCLPSLPVRTLKTSKHPRDIIEVRRSALSHS